VKIIQTILSLRIKSIDSLYLAKLRSHSIKRKQQQQDQTPNNAQNNNELILNLATDSGALTVSEWILFNQVLNTSKEVLAKGLASLLHGFCRAILDLHEHSIFHAGIRPENLFVTRKGFALLSDYCEAQAYRIKENETTAVVRARTKSNRTFSAPELLSEDQDSVQVIPLACDAFSLGLALLESLLQEKILSGPQALERVQDFESKNPEYKEILKEIRFLIDPDPNKRIEALKAFVDNHEARPLEFNDDLLEEKYKDFLEKEA
jgi:serine/threonine protein kinase